tara:strand:- start:950 stop:1660 length:711 start_codon:yes stop_codon:yes gene_type:complete
MKTLNNWDNNTWLSSKKYIFFLNNFIKRNIKFKKTSKILDIGCGRAHLISYLNKKNKFENKPVGIDIVKNKGIKKGIKFKKIDAIKYLKNTNEIFDLIIIKQSIHFFSKKKIQKLIRLIKLRLKKKGLIYIMTLDTKNNEIPCFSIMKKALEKSLKKDKENILFIRKHFKKIIEKKFIFKVKIKKKIYIKMLKNRYISCLLRMPKNEIDKGIYEISKKYYNQIIFRDRLICLIYKN